MRRARSPQPLARGQGQHRRQTRAQRLKPQKQRATSGRAGSNPTGGNLRVSGGAAPAGTVKDMSVPLSAPPHNVTHATHAPRWQSESAKPSVRAYRQ